MAVQSRILTDRSISGEWLRRKHEREVASMAALWDFLDGFGLSRVPPLDSAHGQFTEVVYEGVPCALWVVPEIFKVELRPLQSIHDIGRGAGCALEKTF